MKELTRAMLSLIEQYEEVPRAALAMNVRHAMKQLGLTDRGECVWLANLFHTTRNTTYSWLAPNRHAKVPLKVVVTLALKLDVSLDVLLDSSVRITNEQLRKVKQRPSYKKEVLECAEAHSDWSVKQIATELGIGDETVRRHLKLNKKD